MNEPLPGIKLTTKGYEEKDKWNSDNGLILYFFQELYHSVHQAIRILCEGLKELRPFNSLQLQNWFGDDQLFGSIFKIPPSPEHTQYVQYANREVSK